MNNNKFVPTTGAYVKIFIKIVLGKFLPKKKKPPILHEKNG